MSVGELRVGTCSWMDKGLVGSGWYPEGIRDARGRLGYYASRFDTVEVDSSYYAIPREDAAYRWVARTPRNFLFNIKVFGLFTYHRVPRAHFPPWAREAVPVSVERPSLEDLPLALRSALWERFHRAVLPLHSLGRLGYLLFQLPPWFRFEERRLAYLRRVAEVCRPMKAAVEVRHRSWIEEGARETFLDVLRQENLAYVAVDEPELSWTVPPHWFRTASWGTVLRFHGRNVEAWKKPGASVAERFGYNYSMEELRSWKERILSELGSEGRVFVLFNNCAADFAVRNALSMKVLLGLLPATSAGEQMRFEGMEEDEFSSGPVS